MLLQNAIVRKIAPEGGACGFSWVKRPFYTKEVCAILSKRGGMNFSVRV